MSDITSLNVPRTYKGVKVLDALPIIYTFPAGFVAVNGLATATAVIQTQQNTVFRCLYGTAATCNAATRAPLNNLDSILFQLTESGSNQRYFTHPVRASACFGSGGGLPYLFPVPFDVGGNGGLTIDITNTDAGALGFEIFLHGFKLYLAGPMPD